MSDPFDGKFEELFRKVDSLLSRPDIMPLLSAEAATQLTQLRDFAHSWPVHSSRLTQEQKAVCFTQLSEAVNALATATAELDQMRLKAIPVEKMGKA